MRKKGFWFLLWIVCFTACVLKTGDGSVTEQSISPYTEMPFPTSAATVAVSATPVPTPTQTPTPTPTPTLAPFSILCIPDTQRMAQNGAEALDSMASYVEQTYESSNILLALHMGDLVDSATSQKQWDTVREPFWRIQNRVPVLYVAGNHDLVDREGDGANGIPKRLAYYISRDFVQASLNGLPCYKGGEAAAYTFTYGEDSFLVVTTCHQPKPDCRRWVRDQFSAHPDHIGILVSHSALHDDGSLETYGRLLHRDVVSVCPNVRFVLCGHYRTVISRTDHYDDDLDGTAERSVVTMMLNFQDFGESGYGYLRLLTFDPVTRSVTAETYSPYHDSYRHDRVPDSEMSFVLTDAF